MKDYSLKNKKGRCVKTTVTLNHFSHFSFPQNVTMETGMKKTTLFTNLVVSSVFIS